MSLAIPIQPSNLRLSRKIPIDSDVFNICERVKELDPRLTIHAYDPPVHVGDKTYNYGISEQCDDGVERLVYRVEALDGRIIEHLQYLLHVPFERRFAIAERLADAAEEERKEADLDELYETMGRPMLTQLEHDGFIQRPRSYAKRGVKPR